MTGLTLSHQQTLDMIEYPQVYQASFSGSTQAGGPLAKAATQRHFCFDVNPHDIGCIAYLSKGVELEPCIESIIHGAVFNAGQSRNRIKRVLIHEKHYSESVERIKQLMSQQKLDDPLDESTDIGPMAYPKLIEEFFEQLREFERQGALITSQCDSESLQQRGFIPPTLIEDPECKLKVKEAIGFAPVLLARPVSSDDEAIEQMNSKAYHHTASLWSKDPQHIESLSPRLLSRKVYANEVPLWGR